jgi:hypothetical protein
MAREDATERDVVDPLVAMDQDSPESVRVTFVVLTAIGGALLLLPRQWVSSAILFAASLSIGVYHLLKRRKARAKQAPARAAESVTSRSEDEA